MKMPVPKRIYCLALFLFLICCCSYPAFGSELPVKERIGILGFDGTVAEEYKRTAVSELSMILIKFDRYELIERVDIDKILAEQNFQMTNSVDPASTVEIGKILGIQWAFIGAINELNATASRNSEGEITGYSANAKVTIKTIDIATGKILQVIDSRGTGFDLSQSSALHNALRSCFNYQVTAEFRTKLAPFCRIVKVDGNQLYLNHGRDLGLQMGTRYAVVRSLATPTENGQSYETDSTKTFTQQIGYAEVREVTDYHAMAHLIWSSVPITESDLLEEEIAFSRELAGINIYTTRCDLRPETNIYELCYMSSLPYSGYYKGTLGFAPLIDGVFMVNLGFQIGWEKPIIPGVIYFTPFVGAGVSNCYQIYDDGFTTGLADAIKLYNPYATGGIGLKLYLNHENSPQIQFSMIGQLGPYYLEWWDVNDRDYNVTDHVQYPFFGVVGYGLQLTLIIPIDAPQTNYAQDLLNTFNLDSGKLTFP